MKKVRVAVMVALSLMVGVALASHRTEPMTTSDAYLKPDLKAGEQLTDVFSKTVSIRGTGFKEHVGRIAGSADYTVTAVTPEAITLDSSGRYDGYPPSGLVRGLRIQADGITQCYQGKCMPDDETSGLTFNKLLWGNAPRDVKAGSQWSLKIPEPWEIGPAGTEQVRVVSVDLGNGEITLVRHGRGEGPSSDHLHAEKAGKPLTITTTDDTQIDVTLIPGKATWSGYTTVRRGVIVGDEIMVTQKVKLVAKDGRTFDGVLRAYTLLDLARDAI